MSGPLILHCLKKRFENNLIYTNVGTICISVNPYKHLPIYGRDVIEKYMYRGVEERPPHVFNIAHNAFKGMKDYSINQSIIISGESGAGKTEATKQCLTYIAAIAGSVGGVEKKVLQANPILEAFGNAKTIRNDNSSRFGKYMELFFEPEDGRICGIFLVSCLLFLVMFIFFFVSFSFLLCSQCTYLTCICLFLLKRFEHPIKSNH